MKITKSVRIVSLATIFSATVWVTDTSIKVEARTIQFCNDGAYAPEIELWNTLLTKYGQSTTLLDWHRNAYQANEAFWTGWGYEAPFDINRPYAKFLNAAYLLKEGLSDNANQWHGSIDYRDAGEALSLNTHYNITYLPSVRRDWLAYANTSYIERETLLGCLLFDLGEPTNNPSVRASDFIHEGWHHWQAKYNHLVGHQPGNPPCCELTGSNCDWFYPHPTTAYAFGFMWMEGWTPPNAQGQQYRLSHTPNQAQVEFLSDLALYPASFVPTSIRFLAQAEANERLTTRFVNCVGYTVAIPTPF